MKLVISSNDSWSIEVRDWLLERNIRIVEDCAEVPDPLFAELLLIYDEIIWYSKDTGKWHIKTLDLSAGGFYCPYVPLTVFGNK